MDREEAIRRIEAWNLDSDDREVLAVVIPELTESDDERIRKGMIDEIKAILRGEDLGFPPQDVLESRLAYLEKQKENTWSEEDDEKVKAMCKEGDLKPSEMAWLKNLRNRVWKEPQHAIRVTKGFGDPDGPQFELVDLPEEQKPEWSEEDKRKLNRIYGILGQAADERPFGSSKRIIGDKEAVELQDFIRSIRPQQIVEWSEEDEIMLKWIEDILLIADDDLNDKLNGKVSPITDSAYSSMKMCIAKCRSWLEFLRPQYNGDVTMTEAYKMGLEAGKASSWKPSEEDLMMLEHIIGQYETGNKNSKAVVYLSRIEELDFLKKVFAIWKS